MLFRSVATLLRAAQILLGRRCRFQRWLRFNAPAIPCSNAGAASSGGDASTRRSNPARSQVPLPAVAALQRTGQTLLGCRCRFQRWRCFYAPLKSCFDDVGAASSGGDASTRRSNPARAQVLLPAVATLLPLKSSGHDASTRRSNPALTQLLLPAVATLVRATQVLLGRRCRFQRWRRFYAPLKSCSDAGAASSGGDASPHRSNPART